MNQMTPHQTDRWFVVMSKPRQEEVARENLARQGFELYLPVIETEGQPSVALFPRYLFLKPGYDDQSLETVRSSRGVSHLVRFGDRLATATDGLIESIRALEVHLKDSAAETLSPHDRVEILSGPFAGYDAEVAGSGPGRVIVLMRVLGSEQSLGLPLSSVRKVSSAASLG